LQDLIPAQGVEAQRPVTRIPTAWAPPLIGYR
jgi:hypothetical protein